MSELKNHAIKYNLFGLRTIPLTPRNKIPIWREWVERATADISITSEAWNSVPNANIGVALGEGFGGYFIDVETDVNEKENGEIALKNWCETNNITLPATATYRTGSGGLHRWFKTPAAVGNSVKVLPCVDVRGQGGQSVVPPSIHPNGNPYEWLPRLGIENFPQGLPTLPFELLDLITARKSGDLKAPMEIPSAIPEGSRNDTLFRLACKYRNEGRTHEEILRHIEVDNEELCNPPLDTSELRTICEQAAKYRRGENKIIPEGDDVEKYEPADYTDAGNAIVFTRYARGKALYVDALGWLAWDGMKWEMNEHKVLQLGIDLTNLMQIEAGKKLYHARTALTAAQTSEDEAKIAEAAKDEKSATAYLKHAKAIRSRSRIEAMLALSIPQFVVSLDSLDADPFALNTPAGIVDLRTGDIRPHDTEARCTKITAISPGEPKHELWSDFLKTVTCGDSDLTEFLQETAGMAAIGRVYMEKLIIALGSGENGKSSLFNALQKVFGDYAGGINPDVLTGGKQNKGADLANLQGKRLVIAAELEEGKRLSSDMLKRIASTDRIMAERKYKDPEEFDPSHTTILFTNHAPRLSAIDTGTKRRLYIIPFNAKITADGDVKDYAQHLFDNCGGTILSWIIKGAQKFHADKYTLEPCRAVQNATAKFILDNDWMARFIDECCVTGVNETAAALALYQRYAIWAPTIGEIYVRNNNDFAAELERRNFTQKRSSSARLWCGLSLKTNGQGAVYDFPANTM